MVNAEIPEGRPKSGRVWKVKQKSRASSLLRTGMLKNQSKTFEERQQIREEKKRVLDLEKEMKEETQRKAEAEKLRRMERKKRLMEAEFKNTSYQAVIILLYSLENYLLSVTCLD